MPDDEDDLDEIMARLEEMSESPGSDDVIELYGEDSGFAEPENSGFGSFPELQDEQVIYTDSSG